MWRIKVKLTGWQQLEKEKCSAEWTAEWRKKGTLTTNELPGPPFACHLSDPGKAKLYQYTETGEAASR